MAGIKDNNNLDELRNRLYSRGSSESKDKRQRHDFVQKDSNVSGVWNDSLKTEDKTPEKIGPTTDVRTSMEVAPAEPLSEKSEDNEESKTPARSSKRYRLIILGLSVFFFTVVVSIASVYLFFGGNQISGNNIEVTLNGPEELSGGDTMPLQVGVTNQNSVSIESVMLIMNYPSGTRSSEENSRDLYEERIPLEDVGPGETLNLPIRVVMFGEESEKKEINATIEYRLKDSNGTFFKKASPLPVEILSAAVVIGVESVKRVSSGQEVDITLNVRSNSQSPINDLLVSADYPELFDFIESEPSAVYGQSAWLINELKPEEVKKITIRGVLTGLEEEEAVVKFTAGKPQVDNQFIIGAALASADASFFIERPFIKVSLNIENENGFTALNYGSSPNIDVSLINTLKEPVYDMVVEATVSGNVLDEQEVDVANGYYNSIKDVVRWDSSSYPALSEVTSGASRSMGFSIEPNAVANTASMQVEFNVYARRVLEDEVSEELIGSSQGEIRFTSSLGVLSEAARNVAGFTDYGPVPPVAEETTSYTITLAVQAGANDVTDARLTTSIPQYVDWLDNIEGYGDLEYNPVSKRIAWDIGDVAAEEIAQISFQVELTPSLNQIGEILSLVGQQQLEGVDRFTGVRLQATGFGLNTSLSAEQGYGDGSGVVQDPRD